jgi:hypothetical protein
MTPQPLRSIRRTNPLEPSSLIPLCPSQAPALLRTVPAPRGGIPPARRVQRSRSFGWGRSVSLVLLLLLLSAGGCTTIRVTDPPRSADEEFLITGAAESAVQQLSTDMLRDRIVYVDTQFLIPTLQPTAPDPTLINALARQPSPDYLFLIGEVRAKLLKSGVRLTGAREKAQVVLELRSGALSTNRLEYLLGIPASLIPSGAFGGVFGGSSSVAVNSPTVAVPELSIVKSTKQYGFASVSFVAYWADSGELLSVSGPFVGRTAREDYWIFGTGPRTIGNIPPAQK